MACFEISNRVLCYWLWNEENKQKSLAEVILEHIMSEQNYSQDQFALIMKNIEKTFLPHYRRVMKRYNRKISDIEKRATSYLDNSFVV